MLPKTKRGKIIAGLMLAVVLLVFVYLATNIALRDSDPDTYDSIINQAIERQDIKLCEQVSATTRPGPTDAPEKITGQKAVDWCKQQVEAGERILGG